MSSLKVGIIGCGKQAPKHIAGFRADGAVEIVLADVDDRRAKDLADREGIPWCSVDAMFGDPEVGALSICTPTPAHAPLIRRAVDGGKHFLCEKPLCETVEQAEEIAAWVEGQPVIGMVGFLYRFAPVFEQGFRLAGVDEEGESRALGRVHTAHFRIGGRGSHQVWKHRRETGGGAINEMLVHMLDLALWYFGGPAEVRVHRRELLSPVRAIQGEQHHVDAEDYVLVSMRTETGVEIVLQADLLTPAFSQSVEVQGTNGTFRGSITGDVKSFVHLNQAVEDLPVGRTPFSNESGNLFVHEVGEFLSAVRAGKPPARCNIDDAVRVMRLTEMVHTQDLQ